jgi:hypothetical protein
MLTNIQSVLLNEKKNFHLRVDKICYFFLQFYSSARHEREKNMRRKKNKRNCTHSSVITSFGLRAYQQMQKRMAIFGLTPFNLIELLSLNLINL